MSGHPGAMPYPTTYTYKDAKKNRSDFGQVFRDNDSFDTPITTLIYVNWGESDWFWSGLKLNAVRLKLPSVRTS